MTRDQLTRARRKAHLELESLDERLAPSQIAAGALHAAAQVRAQASRPKPKAAPKLKAGKLVLKTPAASGSRGNAASAPAHGNPAPANTTTTTTTTPTTDAVPTNPVGLPPLTTQGSTRLGPTLSKIYNEYSAYLSGGSQGTFASSLNGLIRIEGNRVGVDLTTTGNLENYVSELLKIPGVKIETTSASLRLVEGTVAIDQLATIAARPDTASIQPIYGPKHG